MKFALHTSTAISSVLKEPEHFYVDIYYLIILIIVAFTLLLLSFLRYHLYKTKKEKELREIASLVDKNEILIQRYSREMSHIKEQLEAKEKCLKEYQHAAQWKAHRDVESLIKEKERLAKCLLEQLDTFKKLKILSKSETILPDSDWRNLIEIVNTLYDDFISRLRVAYPDLDGEWVTGEFNGTEDDYEYAERIIRFRNPRFAISISSPLYWDVVYGPNSWDC